MSPIVAQVVVEAVTQVGSAIEAVHGPGLLVYTLAMAALGTAVAQTLFMTTPIAIGAPGRWMLLTVTVNVNVSVTLTVVSATLSVSLPESVQCVSPCLWP